MVATRNVKLAAFTTRYYKCTSRTLVPGRLDLVRVQELRSLHLREKEYSSLPDEENSKNNPKNWSKTIKSIELWLSRFLRETKLPLSYMVRTEASFPAGLDPIVGESDTDYTTHEDEMVARAPIFINNINKPVTGEFA